MMKKQLLDYMNLVKNFMRKHLLLMITIKVVKIAIVIFFFSCDGKSESSKDQDTILVDTIHGNSSEDSVIFKNDSEKENNKDENDKEEEENSNPLVPQES